MASSDGINSSQLNIDYQTKEFFGKILKITNSLYMEISQRKGNFFNLNVYKFFLVQLPNILLNAKYNESETQNTLTKFIKQGFCELYNKDISAIETDPDYKEFINFINYIK